MVALHETNWIEDQGDVVPDYGTEPNASLFAGEGQASPGMPVSDVYEGYVPPALELTPNERRLYAIGTRAMSAEQQELMIPTPEPTTEKELPSDDNRNMWRQPIVSTTTEAVAPRPATQSVSTKRGPGYRTAAQRRARDFEARARQDRWGR